MDVAVMVTLILASISGLYFHFHQVNALKDEIHKMRLEIENMKNKLQNQQNTLDGFPNIFHLINQFIHYLETKQKKK